jgi:hypothetical protein
MLLLEQLEPRDCPAIVNPFLGSPLIDFQGAAGVIQNVSNIATSFIGPNNGNLVLLLAGLNTQAQLLTLASATMQNLVPVMEATILPLTPPADQLAVAINLAGLGASAGFLTDISAAFSAFLPFGARGLIGSS